MSRTEFYITPRIFDYEKNYSVSGKCLNTLYEVIKIPRENTESELCYKIGFFTSILEQEDFNEIPT